MGAKAAKAIKPRTVKDGFSLIELLVVVAVIGIIGAVGTPTLIQARDRARVGEVSAQLEADLDRARSSSRRNNQDARLVWNTNNKGYSVVAGGKTLERTIPVGVSVSLSGISGNTITYTAPFGELSGASNPTFTVQRTGKADIREQVKALGVTGKVYREVKQ